jgi:FkbM family methyltransferase
LNNLNDVITPINVAIGSQGYIEVPLDASLYEVIDKIYEDEGALGFRVPNVTRVKAVSLTELMKITNAKPDVLKLDCEGCEYEIIDDPSISLFNELGIECHSYITGRSFEDCINKLGNFRCVNIKHFKYKGRAIIHCVKRN